MKIFAILTILFVVVVGIGMAASGPLASGASVTNDSITLSFKNDSIKIESNDSINLYSLSGIRANASGY